MQSRAGRTNWRPRKGCAVRSVFVFLIVLGLSPASADDQSLDDTVPSSAIDKAFNTASITRDLGPAEKPVLILKKTDRLPRTIVPNQDSVSISHDDQLLLFHDVMDIRP